MRCPSCGTDNAPDSRFCGGCGARLSASPSRVAPTQKISDDDRFPQRQVAPAAAPVTAPGVVMPRPISAAPHLAQRAASTSSAPPPRSTSAPAPSAHPISTPPGGQPQRPGSAAPEVLPGTGLGARPPRMASEVSPGVSPNASIGDPSLSLPMPARRPWTLIFVVLVIDLGLAVSGAWMLYQGLGAGAGSTTTSNTSSSATSSSSARSR